MIRMKASVRYVLLYIALLIPSCFFVGLFFTTVIAPLLWYEWDSLPVIDLFTSPSVHATGWGAHFIASPPVVYLIWNFFLAIVFLLPGVVTALFMRIRK